MSRKKSATYNTANFHIPVISGVQLVSREALISLLYKLGIQAAKSDDKGYAMMGLGVMHPVGIKYGKPKRK